MVTEGGGAGGRGVASARWPRIDAASGEVLEHVEALAPDAVRARVERARAAQEGWALTPLEERARRVLLLRDAMVDASEGLVRVLVEESGRPPLEALAHELLVVADLVTFHARHARTILAPRETAHRVLRHRRSYVHHVPKGVVAVLAPPMHGLAFGAAEAASALLAGNAAVLQPQPEATVGLLALERIWGAAGLPADLFQVLPGDRDVRAALIAGGVDHVAFAGRVDEAREVASRCGAALVPCALLVGGGGAAVVCADADVERTARALVHGAFAAGGRSLLAVEQAYVHVGVHEAVMARVTALARAVRVGRPGPAAFDVGPLPSEQALERVVARVEEAVAHGARAAVGPTRLGPRLLGPTVLEGVVADMTVVREGSDGPVLSIARTVDDDDAVARVNVGGPRLVAHVFGKDRERARRVAERLRAGSVMINDVFSAYGTPETAFGGVGRGGWGKVHGEEGLRALTEERLVSYDRIALAARNPLWFPYGEGATQAVRKALRLLYRRGSTMKKILDLF